MSNLDARSRWLALYVLCLASLMIVLDVTIVERRAALDPRRPRLLRDVARMGRERVRPHVRRVPAPRRASWRPLRAPEAVPDRDQRLHAGLARVWARDLAGVPDRRARRAGRRRSDRLGGLALADGQPLHRAGRAREGNGHLRLRRGRRRQPRRRARRDPDGHDQLALDLPRQLPDRRARRAALAAAAADGACADGRPAARHRRRGDDHRRADDRCLRDRQR